MSVKAQGLVWDLPCPTQINGVEFKPSHKYVLVAYADHADHNGKNIFPAVPTVARKTGLDDRSVQRLTKELHKMGLLIEDGMGPRGTNRWALPYDQGGDKLSPVTNRRGDKIEKSLGDIPSGDIPSGDNLSPELKELNQENILTINNDMVNVWETTKEQMQAQFKKAQYVTWIAPTEAVSFDGRTLTVAANNPMAVDWLTKNVCSIAQNILGVYVRFTVQQETEE